MATHWTDEQTSAHKNVSDALGVVDSVISYMSDGQGKPAARERALFAAAVVFIYGVWESFIEQLAIELADHVSSKIEPEKVPKQVRQVIEKRTPWEMNVTPGWRKLWSEHVRLKALGDEEDETNKYGMNTAREGQVAHMLSLAGVNDPFKGFPIASIPAYLPTPKKNAKDAINELVSCAARSCTQERCRRSCARATFALGASSSRTRLMRSTRHVALNARRCFTDRGRRLTNRVRFSLFR